MELSDWFVQGYSDAMFGDFLTHKEMDKIEYMDYLSGWGCAFSYLSGVQDDYLKEGSTGDGGV